MDFSQPYQTPNLAAVLQTLAACAPARPAHVPQTQEDELEEGEYDPTEYHPIASHSTQQPAPSIPIPQQYNPPQHQPPQSSHHASQSYTPETPSAPSKPQPPPRPTPAEKASTITTYPAALRHTTTLLSTSPTTVTRIRHLIHTAHTHERQWHSSRRTLHTQLSTRSASRAKLNSVLASIGGHVTIPTPTPKEGKKGGEPEQEVDMEKEIRLYDRKVHKAYREMVEATEMELRRLGVPFFCTRGELVVADGEEEGGGGERKEKGKVGRRELGMLRGRMVGFLEEWVREEG
ncbi:MAG: hypothetical protein Q9169_006738 [Polycauliona sp. 2 TL-2023]